MTNIRAIALSGGVGGAKLVLGLHRTLAPGELMVIANTGDDFEHLGLHISPDIDTLIYTLANRVNPETGWGRAADTWSFMSAMEELGGPTWFQLGDMDLVLHVWRSERLKQGASLSEVTRELAERFGIATTVIPMSNDPVRTLVETDEGRLDFQHYFVKKRCHPKVRSLRYAGAAEARPSPELLNALRNSSMDVICICPSNPYLSISPILAVNDMRTALAQASVPVVAVSPIIGGLALKGPTAKIMRELGLPSNVASIGLHYCDLIDGLIIDESDYTEAGAIEALGIEVDVANIVMETLDDRCDLACRILEFADRLQAVKRGGKAHGDAGAG